MKTLCAFIDANPSNMDRERTIDPAGLCEFGRAQNIYNSMLYRNLSPCLPSYLLGPRYPLSKHLWGQQCLFVQCLDMKFAVDIGGLAKNSVAMLAANGYSEIRRYIGYLNVPDFRRRRRGSSQGAPFFIRDLPPPARNLLAMQMGIIHIQVRLLYLVGSQGI